jgi:Txe/YoeB family toxin of Txe-Axe toxin-antitoxin module
MKEVFVAFINQKIKKEFESLMEGKFEDKKLYNYIVRAIEDLKQNPSSGVKIPRDLWPSEYLRDHKINNLWKYDLPNAWRLVYTLESDEVKIMTFILEWFNHKDYEKRFGY